MDSYQLITSYCSLVSGILTIITFIKDSSGIKKCLVLVLLIGCFVWTWTSFQPSYDDLIESAQISLNKDDADKAIKEATKAIKKNSSGIDAYHIRAQSYVQLGKFDLAIDDYRIVKEYDSQDIIAYEKCGDIYYYNLKMYDQAYDEYVIASGLNPNNNYYLSQIKEIENMRKKDSLYREILTGTWTGVYGEGNRKANASLEIIDYQNSVISAVFYFSDHPDNPGRGSGSYKMEGELTNDPNIKLNGYEWIENPNNFSFYNIDGHLDISKYRITNKQDNLFLQKQLDDSETNLETGQDNEMNPSKIPLSSAILVRCENLKGYMVNSNYATLRGEGFNMDYVASSMGIELSEVISLCTYAPFDVIYNLERKYETLIGEIAFDDISGLGINLAGLTGQFEGDAEIIFLVDDEEKERIDLSLSDFAIPFSVDVSGGKKLTIQVSFPYYNDVLDNYYKYFNIIDTYLE